MKTTGREHKQEGFTSINVHEDEDLGYWCARFNCTEKQIWAATTVVGFAARTVEEYLRMTNQIE